MQAIRQIIDDAPEAVAVPKPLRHRKLEITFRVVEEPLIEKDASGWPIGFFATTAGCLADDPIERAPQGDYEQRRELE